MLGQGYNAGLGQLNPNRGLSGEADLPFAQDSLDRLGARVIYASPFSVPWSWTRGALGITKKDQNGTPTAKLRYSDALTNASNKVSELDGRQLPIFVFVNQLPVNTQTNQDKRLPLAMVAPSLAWRPG